MSDSLVFLRNRADEVCIFDPDGILHTDDLPPIMLLAAAVISEGYAGVAVDELQLDSGRYVQSLDVNLATHEGVLFQELSSVAMSGGTLPSAQAVLNMLAQRYRTSSNEESGQNDLYSNRKDDQA
jgi:hypothetical protein